MKKMKTLVATLLLVLNINVANAGGGLSLGAIGNLAQGNILLSAIGGGLGAASLMHGINLVNRGSVGVGVFFLILDRLEEEKAISAEDHALIEGADVATQKAFLEIIGSEEMSEAEKEEALTYLFE
jgi:hypothetical protein